MKFALLVRMIAASLIFLLFFLWISPRFNNNELPKNMLLNSKRVLIVFAHTDDEVTNSGFLSELARSGAQLTIVTLTDGRANPESNLAVCKIKDIWKCRQAELYKSAEIIGIKRVVTPEFPDSNLDMHEDAASEVVKNLIFQERPDLLFTMEPSGLNGNRDHIAAHRIAMKALKKSGLNSDLKVILSTLPFPLSLVLKSQMNTAYAQKYSFKLKKEVIQRKIKDVEVHASQAVTMQKVTGGLGPKALFYWINYESYFILEGEKLSQFLNDF